MENEKTQKIIFDFERNPAKLTKIGDVAGFIQDKIDKEKNVSFYVGKAAKYVLGASAVAGVGISVLASAGVISDVPTMALAATLTASISAMAGLGAAFFEEKKQKENMLREFVKDISHRRELSNVEEVVLNRYDLHGNFDVNKIVKENVLKTDINLESLGNITASDIEKKARRVNVDRELFAQGRKHWREENNRALQFGNDNVLNRLNGIQQRIKDVEKTNDDINYTDPEQEKHIRRRVNPK